MPTPELERALFDAVARDDVASTNRLGGTALIPAAEHGHVDTVRMLIEAGVPVDHVNEPGWTALLEAVVYGGRTALQNAERRGQDAVATLRAR
ncbi:ankyrin repeat domain-containing protein [Rhodococcus sp. IEGM 248]|nr:ankyrin repeat domain-containing protein [Rhodococcus sp. IEGM 248]